MRRCQKSLVSPKKIGAKVFASAPIAVLFVMLSAQALFACGCDHNGLDGVHTVLRLVENLASFAAENLVGNFLLGDAVLLVDLAANAGLEVVEAGQAVEEDAIGIAGLLHHVHGHAVGGEHGG